MRGVQMLNGRILYFGNPAGYITRNTAVVDPIFRGEALEEHLKKQGGIEQVTWKGGVYDRLVNRRSEAIWDEPLKSLRVWQLKPEVNVRMKFSAYDSLIKQFGEPEVQNYQKVYDGEIETNDLEEICEKFDSGVPVPGYSGHPILVSDVIELYDGEGSEFYYVDSRGFQPITFGEDDTEQIPAMPF